MSNLLNKNVKLSMLAGAAFFAATTFGNVNSAWATGNCKDLPKYGPRQACTQTVNGDEEFLAKLNGFNELKDILAKLEGQIGAPWAIPPMYPER